MPWPRASRPRELIAELLGRATGVSGGRGGQHAPVQARNWADGHQRHRRPQHPAGRGRRLHLQAAPERPRGGGLFRRWGGQQRRFPRGPEPGRRMETARPLCLREQPVCHRSALCQGHGEPQRGLAGVGLWHCAVWSWTATTSWPSTVRRERPCALPAPEKAPPSWNARPIAPGPIRRGCATRAIARAKRSRAWRARNPIELLQNRLLGEGLASAAELQQIDDEISAQAVEAHTYAQNSPWPDPATVAEHVFSSCNPE